MDLLLHMLDSQKMDSVLVFSRTKHGADKISHRLERRGIKSVAIHSNRTQAQRQRALDGFKQGQFRVLVATDVAARGIDVEGISHVVNYDIPSFPEDYIHRTGRTGRASAMGDAITFVGRNEMKHLKKLEYFTSKRFELKKYPGFDYTKAPESPVHSQASQHRQHEPRRHSNQPRSHHHPQRHLRNQRPHGAFSPRPAREENKSAQPTAQQVPGQDWRKLLGEFVDTFAGKKKKFKRPKTG